MPTSSPAGPRSAASARPASPGPPYDDVLAARADRVAQVRDYLATITPEALATQNDGPPWCGSPVTALDCIRIIGNEEWQHHRFAVRDLDILEARSTSVPAPPQT